MLARQIAVAFGIALIFPLLVYYGVAMIFSPPKVENASYRAMIVPSYPTPEERTNPTPEERQKYLDQQKQWQQELQDREKAYAAAAKDFAHRLVLIMTPLGIAAIFIGAYISPYFLGTGLIFGGIFTVTWGYWNYWLYLEDWVRFVSLLAGFAILLFVGYRRIATPAAQQAS